MPHYVLDLSRLIAVADKPAPTGIDRVEFAYAREFLGYPPEQVSFAAETPWRRFGGLDRGQVEAFLAALTVQWRDGGEPRKVRRIAAALCRGVWLGGERRLFRRLRVGGRPIVYLNVSHHHLERPASIAALISRAGARFVPLVHDIIPIQYPEYVRPGQDQVHARRIDTVARFANAIIVNSAATAQAIAPVLAVAGRRIEVLVAPLGLDLPQAPTPSPHTSPLPIDRPYFICIGTIEPRKNHLLLLTLWRQLVSEYGDAVPHLVFVGRRGWENENIVDLLDRCPGLQGKVHEFSSLSDRETARMLRDARALLLPSFAEGYGLPLIEAVALGVPVLCSDIPVFREVGGRVPEFIDPIDGRSWRQAIIDYSNEDSPRRRSQLLRMAGRAAPSWKPHFDQVAKLLEAVVAR